jgi:hypothetical protein
MTSRKPTPAAAPAPDAWPVMDSVTPRAPPPLPTAAALPAAWKIARASMTELPAPLAVPDAATS